MFGKSTHAAGTKEEMRERRGRGTALSDSYSSVPEVILDLSSPYFRHGNFDLSGVVAGCLSPADWVPAFLPSRFFCDVSVKMPKVRRSRKPPPEGWELIEPTLDELDQKMREGGPSFLSIFRWTDVVLRVVSIWLVMASIFVVAIFPLSSSDCANYFRKYTCKISLHDPI